MLNCFMLRNQKVKPFFAITKRITVALAGMGSIKSEVGVCGKCFLRSSAKNCNKDWGCALLVDMCFGHNHFSSGMYF